MITKRFGEPTILKDFSIATISGMAGGFAVLFFGEIPKALNFGNLKQAFILFLGYLIFAVVIPTLFYLVFVNLFVKKRNEPEK